MVETLDKERIELNSLLVNKAEYSQYLTPVSVARFMASFFDVDKLENLKILDAGAVTKGDFCYEIWLCEGFDDSPRSSIPIRGTVKEMRNYKVK